jgi:hypothetical protein
MLPVAAQLPPGVGTGVADGAGGVADGTAADGEAVDVAEADGEALSDGVAVDVELGSTVARAGLALGDALATGLSAMTAAKPKPTVMASSTTTDAITMCAILGCRNHHARRRSATPVGGSGLGGAPPTTAGASVAPSALALRIA